MTGQKWQLLWLVLLLKYRNIYCVYDASLVTELHAGLFNSSYNPLVRPSETVNVSVRFVVLSLNELDIKTQTMDISGYLEVSWTDPRLAWSGGAYSSVIAINVNDDVVWYPPVVLVNAVSGLAILDDDISPILVTSDGQLKWSPLRNFMLHCDTNPTYYPFDTQVCPIAISIWGYSTSLVDLQAATQNTFSLDFYHENGEWEYIDSSTSTNVVERASQQTLTLTISPTFRRRPEFYVMNTILPIILLGILNGYIFALDAESGSKMEFVLTILLAYTVYLTLVADHIPTTSDNTSILSVLLLMILILSVVSVIISIYQIRFVLRSDEVPIPVFTRKVVRLMARTTFWNGCRRKKRVDTAENKTIESDVENVPGVKNKEKSWVQTKSEPDVQQDSLTWKEVAAVVDHFCFIWYFIITIVCSGCCICIMLYGYVNFITAH